MRFAIGWLFITGLLSASDGALEHAQERYNRTDYTGAIALLGSPESAHSLELLGQCYFMQGEFKKATEVLEKAAALAPNDSLIHTWLGRAYGRRAETAFAFAAVGYANKTRSAFERAVALDPSNGEAVNDLFDYYLQAPGLVGGGLEKARGLIPVIAKIDPSEAQFAQARLDEERKEYDAAEAKLRRAIEMAPHQLGRVLDLAKFLAKRGRYDESEEAFQRAEKLAPNSPRILYARADSYIRTHRNLREARQLLKQYLSASDLTPEDPPRGEALKLLRKAEGA
jgi:tetratricopeptide (TPR) repeat protein